MKKIELGDKVNKEIMKYNNQIKNKPRRQNFPTNLSLRKF